MSCAFSTDPEAGPPSFNQIFGIKDFPSAPPVEDTFQSSVFGTTRLEFQYDNDDNFGYYFLIRDSAGCIQAKGKVANLDTTLQNVNGIEILKIINSVNSNEANVNKFKIYNKNVVIGSVVVSANAPAETCLKIFRKSTNSEGNNKITVRSLKIGDFAIFRDNSSSNPLVNVQMPYADVHNKREFNGTIIFHPETGITADEQLLCTAATIAFKVAMNKKADEDMRAMNKKADEDMRAMNKKADEDMSAIVSCCRCGIILTLIIIGLMVLFFNYKK